MQVIKSMITTDSTLLSSNIPEDEAPEWSATNSYAVGAEVIYDHRVYEAILTISGEAGNQPPTIDQKNWMFVKATNRYRMFDNSVSEASTHVGKIEVVIKPTDIVGGIVLIGLLGESATVIINNPELGETYRETVLLSDYRGINDYYTYFNAPSYGTKTSASFMGFPWSFGSTATVIVEADEGEIAQVGEMIYGERKKIGRTNYNTAIGIKSYSRKYEDDFGNVTVIKRKNSKYAEYDIDIDNYMLSDVQRFFADIDSIPCVFIGNESMEELIVYGFYSDFKAVISFPSVSKCTLRVEGLI